MNQCVIRWLAVALTVAVTIVVSLAANAAEFQMTAAIQQELDRQKQIVAGWAADPTIVNAVKEQNSRGPIAGMDNAKWKTTRRTDPAVKAYQTNPAGQLLRAKLESGNGAYSEAFLSAKAGEKVAFAEKTSSYIHKGQAKFDVPMAGQSWQGKAEFDESSQSYALQVSVPVMDAGQPIGALVVGVNLTHLQKVATK